MLGGGTFTVMNKELPGAYINFVSAERNITIADRGVAALPLEMNWGADGEVIELDSVDYENYSMSIFGYSFDAAEMLPVREMFRNAKKVLIYKLNAGTKASCTISEARYKGTRGNDIKHVIAVNVDDTSKKDVMTYVGTYLADTQTVASSAELEDNDFVVFKKTGDLEATAGIQLTGGANGSITGAEHEAALDALESYSFNVLGCMSEEDSVKKLYTAYCKRMRDELGIKFQVVVYNLDADYIGVINLKNTVKDTGAKAYALIPYVTGAEAGCAINKSLDNHAYAGEYTVKADFKQSELKDLAKKGVFVFHNVGSTANVLSDVNSFVTYTEEMKSDFQLNQVIRVLDQIAIDEAAIFCQKYLGKVQNDEDGRAGFWSDCVTIFKEYAKQRAIEEFAEEDIEISKGITKRDVVVYQSIKPICAMNKLYSTVCVK